MSIVAVLIDLSHTYISHEAKHGEIKGVVNAVLSPEELTAGSNGFWRYQLRSQ